MQATKRSFWKTRFGFYLAAIGSACGLGNLWRFPYIVGENGGGAFLLLYVIIALAVGLPLLVGELILGKHTRKSVLSATASLEASPNRKRRFMWVARATVILSLVVLSYYTVISGWVLHFSSQFLYALISQEGIVSIGKMQALQSNGWLQVGLVGLS